MGLHNLFVNDDASILLLFLRLDASLSGCIVRLGQIFPQSCWSASICSCRATTAPANGSFFSFFPSVMTPHMPFIDFVPSLMHLRDCP